jgi:hypothetical protein
MNNPNEPFWNRTCDLQSCSATAYPGTQVETKENISIFPFFLNYDHPEDITEGKRTVTHFNRPPSLLRLPTKRVTMDFPIVLLALANDAVGGVSIS